METQIRQHIRVSAMMKTPGTLWENCFHIPKYLVIIFVLDFVLH